LANGHYEREPFVARGPAGACRKRGRASYEKRMNENRPDIFISHVEEDQAIVLPPGQRLEAANFSTCYYERDRAPDA
jgi:hypothetical protein